MIKSGQHPVPLLNLSLYVAVLDKSTNQSQCRIELVIKVPSTQPSEHCGFHLVICKNAMYIVDLDISPFIRESVSNQEFKKLAR